MSLGIKLKKIGAMISSVFAKNEYDLNGVEFRRKLESKPSAQLIDVRTPGEFKSGSVTGSVNMDIMDHSFEQQLSRLNSSLAYFVYCRSGARSAAAVKLMRGKGLEAYNLIGGISAWPNN